MSSTSSAVRSVLAHRPRPRVSLRPSTNALRPSLVISRGYASHHHEEHHDEAHEEVYPKEGFGPAWRTTAVLALLTFGITNFAPTSLFSLSDSEDKPWMTRVLEHYAPSSERTFAITVRHLEMTERYAEDVLLVRDAKQPAVRRFRYPLQFEQVSPHNLPIGGASGLDDLVVKH